jgi:integrase
MTPRKASLRVAHARTCPLATLTAIESTSKGSRCKCQPSYYVMWRDPSGATRKSPRVKDRRVATMVLNEKQVEIDKGHVGYAEARDIAFPAWVDEYLEWLEHDRKAKGSTRDGYAQTLGVARTAIGHVDVRRIGYTELTRFFQAFKARSVATQRRYFRELSACLSQATVAGYLDKNPVPAYRDSLRLAKAPAGVPPYTEGEIARILAALAASLEPTETAPNRDGAVYVMLVRAAVATGARIGELVALDWTDLDETAGELHIRHHFTEEHGLTTPKDSEPRTLHLTAEAKKGFADWTRLVGVKTEGPIFTAPRSGGRIRADYARRLVVDAIETAGIAKVDAKSGRPRKPFHSLRATFASQMAQQGRNPVWIQQQLGHSDLSLTLLTYGKWTDEQLHAEADKTPELVAAE